jgi:hypothetical protein
VLFPTVNNLKKAGRFNELPQEIRELIMDSMKPEQREAQRVLVEASVKRKALGRPEPELGEQPFASKVANSKERCHFGHQILQPSENFS